MDSTGLYGSDQYIVDPTAGYPSIPTYKTNVQPGVYEDNLRLDQSRIAATMTPATINPYIQDSITKSQRHHPIRTETVPVRASHIAHMSPEPGLPTLYSGGFNPVVRCDTCARQMSSCGPSHIMAAASNSGVANGDGSNCQKYATITIDSNMLLMVFVFIILVYMCVCGVMSVKRFLARRNVGAFMPPSVEATSTV